ncbi:MAG: ParB/RepB/Spo0J family partition protein, partial [Rhodospirillaceae bacterium]|nr:ParB/RepB/Spo0J family partition protein [Rhodospirillaceae bacterium]
MRRRAAGAGRAARKQPSMETAMNFIAPRADTAEPLIREIPLSRLALAPENVRKTPPDAQADAELKASIAALGLLENLVVRAANPDNDDGTYAVVAGGRRLKAMQALVEDQVFDPDRPVPCQVRSGDVEPAELSLAENVVRIAMHPADQVVAFAKLADAGQTVASIAARFGVSERTVEQRLSLGHVAPELLNAYRAGEIDLDVLKAFTVTADRARQMAVWEQVAGQGYRASAWQVKRMLTEERVPGTAGVARFVGIEDYEAAGGQVLRDLFSRDDESGVWFDDPVLLHSLAMTKLRPFTDELATRWKWAAAMVEVDWKATAHLGRVHPR